MKRMNQMKKPEFFNSPLFSMLISIILVVIAVGMVFGFGNYLRNKTYTGPKIDTELENTDNVADDKEYLDVDDKFKSCYVMICNVPSSGLWANHVPGVKMEDSRELFNGQIVRAVERGTYQGHTYYKLEQDLYISANISHVEPLRSYIELDGYLAITYINSSGVHLRSWADFDADNVVKSVYVGDKVQVKAKVETEKGDSAYVTTDGLYITSNPRYFNDYTDISKEEEKTTEKKIDSSQETTEKTSETWDFSDPELNQ